MIPHSSHTSLKTGINPRISQWLLAVVLEEPQTQSLASLAQLAHTL